MIIVTPFSPSIEDAGDNVCVLDILSELLGQDVEVIVQPIKKTEKPAQDNIARRRAVFEEIRQIHRERELQGKRLLKNSCLDPVALIREDRDR
jgi:hypothetical protein